jgi:hypothetical protein
MSNTYNVTIKEQEEILAKNVNYIYELLNNQPLNAKLNILSLTAFKIQSASENPQILEMLITKITRLLETTEEEKAMVNKCLEGK